jgi:hypothetical protein
MDKLTKKQLLAGYRFIINTGRLGDYEPGKCDNCGKKIGERIYDKNDGLCSKCLKVKEYASYIIEGKDEET